MEYGVVIQPSLDDTSQLESVNIICSFFEMFHLCTYLQLWKNHARAFAHKQYCCIGCFRHYEQNFARHSFLTWYDMK